MNLTKEQHQRLVDIIENKVLQESLRWGIKSDEHPDIDLFKSINHKPFN